MPLKSTSVSPATLSRSVAISRVIFAVLFLTSLVLIVSIWILMRDFHDRTILDPHFMGTFGRVGNWAEALRSECACFWRREHITVE